MPTPTPPPAEDQIFVSDGFDAELFWQKNKQVILIAAACLVVAVVGTVFWLISARSARLGAEAMLSQAKDPEAWQAVITQYPGSMPAADATLLLAGAQREKGELDTSSETYRKFLTEFPNHPLTSGARLGVAENLLVAGKTSEAQTALKEVQTGGGYAAPFAALLEARLLTREGKLTEAQDVYQKIYTADQASPIATIARGQAEELALVIAPAAAPEVEPAEPAVTE